MSKKFFTVLLCLTLLCGLLTVTAMAIDADAIINDPVDNTYVPSDTSITLSVPIVKIVRQTGDQIPGQQIFRFLPTDFIYDEIYGPENNDHVKYTLSGGTIVTNGPGEYYGTLTITVSDEEEFAKLDDGFSIIEVNDGAAGWTYDNSVWGVEPYLDLWSGSHTWAPDESQVTHNERGNGLVFVNTYVGVTEKPRLNKTDHFAFLQGYTDGTFGPTRNMTRGEISAMFARLMVEQMEVGETYSNSFTDVPSTLWCANEIGYLERYGIITGYTDGTFRPNAPVSRAEFAAIACRFEDLTEGTAKFSDVPESHWAAKYINFAAAQGWVTGYSDGTFRPDQPITRAEVAAITCRQLERSADKDYIIAHYDTLPRTFSDVKEGYWAFWSILEAANGHDYIRSAPDEIWTRVYE